MDTNGRPIGREVRKKVKYKPFLPDDIIKNILSWLPAKNAVQSRLVCQTWRHLTSTPDFVDLHFRHSIPMIFVAKAAPKPFLLDKWSETSRPRLLIHRLQFLQALNYFPLFSHAGLIVYDKRFHIESSFIVHNPMDYEKVRVTCSEELHGCQIYGVYFHPVQKGYCSLWMIQTSDKRSDMQPKQIQYKILKFGHNPFFKTIQNPFTHRVKKWNKCPLFIHKYLYWMLDCEQKQGYQYSGRSDIMQFDVISEEFTVKPCPIPIDTKCRDNQTHVLNIDGTLSFLVIFPSNITIWRLEDHAAQLWTAANYTFSIDICPSMEKLPKPIAVMDGKLALLSDRRLLVCNLMQGTTRFFRKKKYYKYVSFLSHQLSLASLMNCKSNIYIDQDGEIDLNFVEKEPDLS